MFLDTNVLVDLINGEPSPQASWSRSIYGSAIRDGSIACNLIVVAEAAAGFEPPHLLIDEIERLAIDVLDLTQACALRGAEAFREYRRRGGPRAVILPDFLIAAHAATLAAPLATRDQRVATYFSELILITPETHPDG